MGCGASQPASAAGAAQPAPAAAPVETRKGPADSLWFRGGEAQIRVGQPVPDVMVKVGHPPVDVSIKARMLLKKVILLGLPGAFTPT